MAAVNLLASTYTQVSPEKCHGTPQSQCWAFFNWLFVTFTPILAHLSSYPGLPDPKPLLDGVVNLIKSLSEKKDVWVVTNQQLLAWMKNPVKASELGSQPYMKCEQPVLPNEICNGLDDNNSGGVDDSLLNK